MTADEILAELEKMGSESIRKVLRNHGVKDPFFGVKIGDMKPLVKKIKKDYQLALDLYDTGNYDAMYLAGLIADDARMTRKDLNRWVKKANQGCLASATVPWVAAGSLEGEGIALEWIESGDETTASAGWVTLACLLALKKDEELDQPRIRKFIKRIEKTIHDQPGSITLAMANYLASAGIYVKDLTDEANAAAGRIGKIEVDRGPTACKMPDVAGMIEKARARGAIGKKKKTVKC